MAMHKNNPFAVIEEELIQELMNLMKEKQKNSKRFPKPTKNEKPDIGQAA